MSSIGSYDLFSFHLFEGGRDSGHSDNSDSVLLLLYFEMMLWQEENDSI